MSIKKEYFHLSFSFDLFIFLIKRLSIYKKRGTQFSKKQSISLFRPATGTDSEKKKKVIIKSFFSFQTDISLGGASALFEEEDCFPLGFVPNIDEIAGPLPETDVIV